jgi:uncharacterized protein YjbI with pentapeptide repeats
MAKKQRSSVLNRLAGKKVVFSGKFDYGVEDALKSMAEAQQGAVPDELTDKVNYLVLADLNAGTTIQKKAAALNKKGATIQVMDVAAFRELVKPTEDELLALLKNGKRGAEALAAAAPPIARIRHLNHHGVAPECPRLVGARLDGLDLSDFDFGGLAFEKCSFIGATLNRTNVVEAIECDFSTATGAAPRFSKINGSRFVSAKFDNAQFSSHIARNDFTAAKLDGSRFYDPIWRSRTVKQRFEESRFAKASLRNCVFDGVCVDGGNFDEADLSGAVLNDCRIAGGSLRNAKATDAILVATVLCNADLTNAMLVGANLAEADLTDSKLDGADLKGANLRGATLNPGTLNGAKCVTSEATAVANAGPALKELDSIFSKAKNAEISFRISKRADEDGEALKIATYAYTNSHSVFCYLGGYVIAPKTITAAVFSKPLLQAGRIYGQYHVRFETVEVSSTKSPKSGKALRDLVIQGIAEAFGQEVPADDVLAAATKTYRDAQREKGAGAREQREQAKAEAEKQKEKAKKQIAKKVQKAVGKVTDIATFLKALEVRIERPKIDKATKMLKASGFKLFNDVTEEHVSGVVKSQTDPDLVYACRLDHEGHYACCTQNLNICGGLRGSICKHLLVLIVGLVQAGELDPETIDGWIAKTHTTKPELDKESMGAIFIKYKGAEAGEVDWRPTETVPEDYYAL